MPITLSRNQYIRLLIARVYRRWKKIWQEAAKALKMFVLLSSPIISLLGIYSDEIICKGGGKPLTAGVWLFDLHTLACELGKQSAQSCRNLEAQAVLWGLHWDYRHVEACVPGSGQQRALER